MFKKNGLSKPLIVVLLLANCLVFPVVAREKIRVCADPDNMPFSNRHKQGFENKIARLLAKDMQYDLEFDWSKLKPGFIRQRLYKQQCDLVMSVPVDYDALLTTRPYYKSGYVFVSLKQNDVHIKSLDDVVLKHMKIGLHAFGSDGMNSPPAQVLAHLGLAANIQGYPVWGNESAVIMRDVIANNIDLAIMWGPLAAYLAEPYQKQINIEFIPEYSSLSELPFQYSMAIGVRKQDTELAAKLNKSLNHLSSKITKILEAHHVPLHAL